MQKNLLSLIIDTGFFIALFSRTDRYHRTALKLRPQIASRSWITTWPVLTESCHLLAKLDSRAPISLLALYKQGAFSVFEINKEHAPRIMALMTKYRDLPMDLADASLVILAEEIGNGDIVSSDGRDFKTYRFKNHKPFRNLLVPS